MTPPDPEPDDPDELETLVSRLLDDRLDDAGRRRLGALLDASDDAVARYGQMLDQHAALAAIYPGGVYLDEAVFRDEPQPATATRSRAARSVLLRSAALSLVVGAVCFAAGSLLGRGGDIAVAPPPDVEATERVEPSERPEPVIAGHAVLRRAVGVDWGEQSPRHREGDVLPAGRLAIAAGLAEIDVFCGASLIIEGPAEIDLESDWAVRLRDGRLRAIVPPVARGFVVRTDEADVVDLGTEFAVAADGGRARVQVLDGEVALRGGLRDGEHLLAGAAVSLGRSDDAPAIAAIASRSELSDRQDRLTAARREAWKQAETTLLADDALIAHYPIAAADSRWQVANKSAAGAIGDGQVVGLVGRVDGRLGEPASALDFSQSGSRVRVLLAGEFDALSLACWVRIDALANRYNALFLGDGYENGEPHWQIRDDGRLMFSVMVDDTQDIRHRSPVDGTLVRDAGLHHVYYTEPVWDGSQSGRWMHLAAVYDRAGGEVRQYVDGEAVAREPIAARFRVPSLRIGPAEIGNWGQPFRESEWFAVRNLHGAIDQMTLLGRPLSGDEIRGLYDAGKPPGH